jgi:hypothetical protein
MESRHHRKDINLIRNVHSLVKMSVVMNINASKQGYT